MSVVIPLRSKDPGKKYFSPRFIKIVVNQTVTWYNTDNDSHSLVFDRQIIPYNIKIGDVGPRGILTKRFDSYVPRIDYSCAMHPEELGTIVIYPKPENEMTNTDTLRHLTGFLGKDPPDILKHLGHKAIPYGETILPSISADHITLDKFLDPAIYRSLADPDLYQFRSKNMTIVFWDISHFSDLCNTLRQQPVMIAGFLREYIDAAIEIIHAHRGIIDKVIGDGILALFGYNSNNDNTNGAIDGINAALDLRKSFSALKTKWIELWSEHFAYNNILIDLKCGMNTGKVLFGLLDTQTRSEVTVIGSTVNLASRIESIAANDQIIITEQTKTLVQERFRFNRINVKDKIQSYPEIEFVYEVG